MPSTHAALDRLTTCLGVYDRSASWPPRGGKSSSSAASNEGDALRRWFLRLSPEARRDALTVTDAPWVQLTLAMAAQRVREARRTCTSCTLSRACEKALALWTHER